MRTLALSSLIILGCVALTATESTIIITAKPKFEQRGLFTYLVLADTNHSLDLVWGMPPEIQFNPVALDANRAYTFTVVQKAHQSITIPELRRVQSSGQTIYDIEVCEVHKTKMEHKEVRVDYGLRAAVAVEPSREIERRLFPHRHEELYGGCVESGLSPKSQLRYFCTDCKVAYEKWKSENTTIQ